MRVNVIKRSRTSSGGDGLKHANARRMGFMECASSVALARVRVERRNGHAVRK